MCSSAREGRKALLKHKDQTTAMWAYAFQRRLASSKFIHLEAAAFSKAVSWHPLQPVGRDKAQSEKDSSAIDV